MIKMQRVAEKLARWTHSKTPRPFFQLLDAHKR